MDDAVGVGEGHRVADAEQHREAGVEIDIGDPAIEPFAADPLHRVEQASIGEAAEVVHRHDARMFQPAEDVRLLGQARGDGGIRLAVGIEHLQGDLAIQRRIAREVDRAHASASEHGEQLVACRIG
jgi:hypothetical protein